MKLSQRTKILISATLIMFVFSAVVAFASPGDSSDPLVTLSYITETLMPEINSHIDQRITQKIDMALASYTPPAKTEANNSFILVNVKKNQTIIGEEGTEFVVRGGSGIIVATSSGGIADLSAGMDLPDGTAFPPNHLLLVPRNDSRGIRFNTDGIVLIKGNYTVKSR